MNSVTTISLTVCWYILRAAGTLGAFLIILLAIIVILQLVRISKAPAGIPWVGLKGRRIFPKLRACLGEVSAGRSMVDEGYEKYSKQGLPFILPGMHWNGVVLPPSDIQWIVQQPETVLSGNKVLDDTLGLEYLAHGPTKDSCRDFTVIRRDLTRQIVKLIDQVLDEIQTTFDEQLGFETEWKAVKLQKVIQAVAFRTVNRIFVGLPLCRTKKYENAVNTWTTCYGLSTLFLRYFVPSTIKKYIMPIVALPTKLAQWWATSHFTANIEARLRMLESHDGKEGTEAAGKPNDMMQWIIDNNAHKSDPAELDPANIAGKMILFNLFATGTTSLMSGVTIFSLLNYDDANSLISALREEAEQTMPHISTDPRATREMVIADSLIRETLRYYPIGAQGLFREVVASGGAKTPQGLHLPQGTHIHSIVSAMQKDTDLLGKGVDEFDPLRYCRQDGENSAKMAVQITEDYISFGLGKHACPGRFFAVHVIKLMLGYLLSRYDLEPLKEKVKFEEFAEALLPSEKWDVRIRRRVDGAIPKSGAY